MLLVKPNLNVLPEATAVVISGGLCISNGLGDGKKTKCREMQNIVERVVTFT